MSDLVHSYYMDFFSSSFCVLLVHVDVIMCYLVGDSYWRESWL